MEAIKANEINEIIRAQIENFDASMTVDEVGTVIKVGDGIAEIYGLEKVMAGELLEFPFEVRGLALNLRGRQGRSRAFWRFPKDQRRRRSQTHWTHHERSGRRCYDRPSC